MSPTCFDVCSILGSNVNSGGRGMNIAIVDSVTRFIQRVSHFDTYEEGDSLILSQMVMWECVNRLLSSILAAT